MPPDDAIMPVFCPTEQAVSANTKLISATAKFSPAFSTSSLLCMGLFSRFLLLPP
jgi:hypothetical protein